VRTEDAANHLAGLDRVSGMHHGRHRLVFRTDAVRVGDDDHPTTSHWSSELHPTAAGSEDKLAGCGCKVDTSVSGGIGGSRPLESM
jgi:hypothetical protein